MPEMQFDFDGLIQLLAHHLYSEKKVFIRELIQNAHDSIRRRQAVESGYGGRIDIDSRPADLQMTIRDNGIGMSRSDLEQYLSSVGKSGTRQERDQVPGLIGQFGIGFLSAFVVAGRVEVRTRKFGEEQGWLWANEGRREYTLASCQVAAPGTTVTVFLKGEEERGVIHEEEVRNVIRRYADMLLVPIHFNGSSGPINTMHMPWEKPGLDERELQMECHLYLERTMHDSVLEAIPVRLSGPVTAHGVLYITRTRAVMVQVPRTVRIFQDRMFLCENVPELLPRWATFINGVFDTPDLTPTAARDNFIRNEAANSLGEALGHLVIQHLEHLAQHDAERFSQLLRYHNWGIKAACYYYNEFFAKFAHLLEWRTNSGKHDDRADDIKQVWRTLPEVLKLLPKPSDGPQPLPCFTTSNSANQYFQMANAAGSLVVDASYPFEESLLQDYTKLDGVHVRLVHVDREDDPNVFRHLHGEDSTAIQRLAQVMSQVLRPGGYGHVRVEARRFQPPTLAAVIRSSERSRGQTRAEELLGDPNTSQDLRELAEEMARLAHGAGMQLTINADNPLIQRLATQNLQAPEVIQVMGGVCNNAILYSQELMTPENARILHDLFQDLMVRSLDYLEAQVNLQAERERLEREWQRSQARRGPRPRHRIFFLMTPFDPAYRALVNSLREMVEDRWHCQLFLASDRKYEDRILDNLRYHIEQADAFVAKVTTANPNVMLELGAVRFDLHERPVVLLRNSSAASTPDLPADLRSHIYVEYGDTHEMSLVDHLEHTMRSTDQRLRALLEDDEREHYLSPRALKERSRLRHLPDQVFEDLAARFPTLEAWQYVEEKDVRPVLGVEADLAGALISRLKDSRV